MNEDLFFLGVKALIRNSEGKILLLKVNNEKFKDSHQVYWDIPGGRIHRGKTVEDTLKREVFEEIGVNDLVVDKPLSMVLSNIRIPSDNENYGLILSVYECAIRDDEKIVLSDEHVEFEWFDPDKCGELLEVKYPKEFTDQIRKLK